MKTSRITRGFALSALAAAALVAPAQPALADGSYFLPMGQGCAGFNLEWSWTGTITHTKEFFDKNGNKVRLLSAGKGTVNTYTNYGTKAKKPVAGESITIRTDGSVTETVYNPDGSQTVTATGHNGLIMFPTDVPAGPSTTHYTGKIVYTIGTDGVFTLLSTSGPSIDVCAELAS
ncbi:hypothetical protein [Arthrobacter sp. HS15c]|uniref:hypothetical protein n=1 Tax=Arthrobacter sp. HS15c TaxID=3230279 RepID=UPI003466A4BD